MKHIFWKSETRIFFARGLDRANQLEGAGENRRLADPGRVPQKRMGMMRSGPPKWMVKGARSSV
ncbi:hypothetical protein [Bradyrhizobium oligotrophicum]|uniref:hypothetical protein n=1 Tax=Bradyrhizobium oligotrophicum TaxID=44255 RepID=UPI003EB96171